VSVSLNGAEVLFTLHQDAAVPVDVLLLPRLWPVAGVGMVGIQAQTLTPALPPEGREKNQSLTPGG